MENDLDSDLSTLAVRIPPKASKKTLGGRPAFDSKRHAQFASQPLEKKAEVLRKQWANIGYILLSQAERFSQSVTKKDYGRLMQLLSSAGIAYDKVVPKGESMGNIQFNLFNGLDKSKLAGVLGIAQGSPQVEVEVIDSIADSSVQSIVPVANNP